MHCEKYRCELLVRGCLARQAARVEHFGLAEKLVVEPPTVVRPKMRTRHPYCAKRCEQGRALAVCVAAGAASPATGCRLSVSDGSEPP